MTCCDCDCAVAVLWLWLWLCCVLYVAIPRADAAVVVLCVMMCAVLCIYTVHVRAHWHRSRFSATRSRTSTRPGTTGTRTSTLWRWAGPPSPWTSSWMSPTSTVLALGAALVLTCWPSLRHILPLNLALVEHAVPSPGFWVCGMTRWPGTQRVIKGERWPGMHAWYSEQV